MKEPIDTIDVAQAEWSWPVDVNLYDRNPTFYPAEEKVLNHIRNRPHPGPRQKYINHFIHQRLERLVIPIHDCLNAVSANKLAYVAVTSIMVREMMWRQRPFWAWTETEWLETLCSRGSLFSERHKRSNGFRHDLIAVAYFLDQYKDIPALGVIGKRHLAEKIFGQQRVNKAAKPVIELLKSWGGGDKHLHRHYPRLIAELLLINGNPSLDALTPAVLEKARQGKMARRLKSLLRTFARALTVIRGLSTSLLPVAQGETKSIARAVTSGVPEEWARWCLRWYETSAASKSKRHHTYYEVMTIGRWLADKPPELTDPGRWTRETAAECIAVVDRLTVGEYCDPQRKRQREKGKPLKPTAKDDILSSMRGFFKDLQEWGWIERKFDPIRALATPKSIRTLIAPDPRVIADEVWAKLLHAGLNLTAEDLPVNECGGDPPISVHWYPLEMVQCVSMIWLFTGLRNDEILRLRVGCIRWLSEEMLVQPAGEVLPQNSVCLLSVPTNKTSTAFTKPVDPIVGRAIADWEKVRPPQPLVLDSKTNEMVHYLFSYRGLRIGSAYLNDRLIPMLCRKAGVPEEDARGRITSHRARSTLATQLYNAKNPMTLFELMEWLGHRSPTATQHYAKITPTKLAKAYADADYFKRNLRMIEVLIDRDVVLSGAAARGQPWRYFDLGHGYCTYDFFDQCPHRMACAKCSFYLPKETSRALLSEGQTNLLHMMQEIRLTDEERAAVEEGIEALKKLTDRLTIVPAPDGSAPPQLVQITGSKSL